MRNIWYLLRWIRDGQEVLETYFVPAGVRKAEHKEDQIIAGQKQGLIYVGEETGA